MKEEIITIYYELQGYLSHAMEIDKGDIYNSVLWTQYNELIDKLSEVTGQDYIRFRISPENRERDRFHEGGSRKYIASDTYKIKLNGLIGCLYGKYFNNEQSPFKNIGLSPNTIINQNQSIQVVVQMVLEVQSKIDEKIKKYEKGSNERTFLEKIKDSLSTVGNIIELITLILRVGNDTGLTINEIIKLFS